MKDILETIVKHLVENQDAVKITEVTKPENENLIEFKVNVAKEDMGKIIGKQGKNARAIRTVMKSVAAKERIAADNSNTGYNPSTLNLILASNFENPLPKIAPITNPKANDLKKLNTKSSIEVSGCIIK